MDDRVTGLVLHFRTPQRTLACLKSLLAEHVRDVVVVDNSEDGGRSLASMASGLKLLQADGLRLTMLRPAQNLGFAGGVSAGLEHVLATGPSHVLLINSDAVLERGALANMLTALQSAAIVVPLMRAAAAAQPVRAIVFYQALFALYLRSPSRPSIRYPSGCCVLIRNDQVRADLFDRDFFFYGEDVMLGFDLARRGIKVVECAEATVIHAGSASAKNGSLFYEYHMVRAHWLLARKLASNPVERFAFVAARCLTLPARALVRSLRFRSLLPWRGLIAASFDVLRGRCRSLTPPAQAADALAVSAPAK